MFFSVLIITGNDRSFSYTNSKSLSSCPFDTTEPHRILKTLDHQRYTGVENPKKKRKP